MNELVKLVNEESKIIFTNGDVIEGSENVAKFVLDCARAYNQGYMSTLTKFGLTGVCGVITIGVATVYIRKRAKSKLEEK